MNKCVVIHFLIGIPCSGKSYFAKNILQKKYKDLVHLDSDEIRKNLYKKYSVNEKNVELYFETIDEETDKIFLEQIKRLVLEGKSFILDNANYKKTTRERIISFIKKISYKNKIPVKIIGYYFVVSKTELEKRNIQRVKRKEKKFLITKEEFKNYLSNYTYPTLEEGFDLLIKIEN